VTEISNVVLLSVDALRADHLSYHGYDRPTSPELDALASKFTCFKRAYSASSHTREALPSLLTGKPPDTLSGHGFRLVGMSLADRLSEASIRTGGFHSNPFASRAYGFGSGFDAFDDDLYLGRHRLLALAQRLVDKLRNRHYVRAAEINERALNWLDEIGDNDRFFLWNHYMDTHGPYQPPSEYREQFTDRAVSNRRSKELYNRSVDDPDSITTAERDTQRDLYDAEIRYVDDQIGAFLNALERRELLSETLVVITADHGDAFGEHGYYSHPRRLDDELLHVPLIVRGPGVPDITIDSPASLLDVAPTLLNAVGCKRDDLPGIPLQQLWSETATCTDRYVFSQARTSDGDRRLFRATGIDGSCMLAADLDSNELTIIQCDDPIAKSTLQEYAHERLQANGARESSSGREPKADGELQERLQALGYRE
jgi:arylsulfatase